MTTTTPPPRILVPVAPPRMIDDVYTDEQYRRMLGVVKREGPWGTIISHHFQTVDEMIATVSGVVADSGGILSHCAIVAREFGLPAVVGTRVGTTTIHDGMTVTVDGTKGLVRIDGRP